MLTISRDTLPQSALSYAAFRVAFLETLERISLARQFDAGPAEGFGFLAEVPFFRAVPPQVQLEALADTWHRHIARDEQPASLIDESVVYSVCETAARVAELDPTFFLRVLRVGPLKLKMTPDHHLASELRALHISLSNEGDFLMISQFEDLPPQTAKRLKKQFGLEEDRLEEMFELLGRWNVTGDLTERLAGLLDERELRRTARILNLRQPAL